MLNFIDLDDIIHAKWPSAQRHIIHRGAYLYVLESDSGRHRCMSVKKRYNGLIICTYAFKCDAYEIISPAAGFISSMAREGCEIAEMPCAHTWYTRYIINSRINGVYNESDEKRH